MVATKEPKSGVGGLNPQGNPIDPGVYESLQFPSIMDYVTRICLQSNLHVPPAYFKNPADIFRSHHAWRPTPEEHRGDLSTFHWEIIFLHKLKPLILTISIRFIDEQ